MKHLKYIIISTITIYLLNVISHFVFDFLPFKIFAVLFPVNESIFQHLKMIFTSYLIFYLLLKCFFKQYKFNNFFTACLVSSLTCILSFLLIYLPFVSLYKENMIFTLILLFLSVLFSQFISTLIIYQDNLKSYNKICLEFIIIIILLNAYLTFNPLKNRFFYDQKHHTYNLVYK